MDLYKWLRNQWDRALAAVCVIAGGVFLVLGWRGASGASLTTEQIPYLASGAVAGLFALGAAATLWLSADLRDEWLKLDEIFRFMQTEAARNASTASAEADAQTETAPEPMEQLPKLESERKRGNRTGRAPIVVRTR